MLTLYLSLHENNILRYLTYTWKQVFVLILPHMYSQQQFCLIPTESSREQDEDS
jgi:hypothetical protein